MKDLDCAELLQWIAPRLRLRPEGFRRVRGQVCKRIGRRLAALGLTSVSAYRTRLESDPEEWAVLDALCRVTISRFYRDARVFEVLHEELLPPLLESSPVLRVWSAGCASGEEPYTVSILFRLGLAPRYPEARLELIATEVDAGLLERARRGCYPRGSLRELPPAWVDRAFPGPGEESCLAPGYREGLVFRREDLRTHMPEGPFQLVLCRNVAFTYFAPPLQREVLAGLVERLAPGGLLVTGAEESLPEGGVALERVASSLPIFRVPRVQATTGG